MGRRRRADRDEILDAVGAVIRDRGLEALSIEAVARAAGIGKASVLYDFGNREALLVAFVERKIGLHRQALEELRAVHAEEPDSILRAFLDYSRSPAAQDGLGTGMLVAAAASGNENFRLFLQKTFAGEVAKIEAEAMDPGRAVLAYLALHGLRSLECFGFCKLDDEKRARALDDIAGLINAAWPAAGPTLPGSEPDTSAFSRKSKVSP